MSSQSLKTWLLTLAFFSSAIFVSAICAQIVNEETDESSSAVVGQQDDLPKFADWRIGDYGTDSKNNGYYRLVYSPNGKYLAARNRNDFVEIYNVETRKQLCQIEGNDSPPPINTIHFAPDSESFLATSSDDKKNIRIWSTQNGNLLKEIPIDSPVAYFSGDGAKIFALQKNSVDTFSWPEGKKLNSIQWKDKNNRVLTLSRDGKLVLVSRMLRNRLYQLHVIDLTSKSTTILDGPTQRTKTVSFSPNGLWVAASYHRDRKIRLWDLRNPHEDKFVLNSHKHTVQSLTFSDDGRFLVSTSWDTTAVVWDLLSKEVVAKFEGHSEHVNSSAFSPIDLTLATGASGPTDSSIIVWDLKPLIFRPRERPKAFESFEVVWKELGSNFPDQAFMAMQAIIESDDGWLQQISDKIGIATQAISQTQIATWIEHLDHPKYRTREEATEKLVAARGFAEPLLQAALKDPASTEVEYRVMKILRRPIKRPEIKFDELRRLHRSIFAMEMIGTPFAREVLTSIASGHSDIDVARDAVDSLERIKAR